MEPLDNPVWHSLLGPHAGLAEGSAARRYPPAVAAFAALPDDAGGGAWDALRALVGPGHVALLVRDALEPPPRWELAFRLSCHQLVAPDHLGDAAEPERFAPLAPADVPEMLELVGRTKPGPFATRTIELGDYLGWRDADGRLMAMAGERMRLPGWTELSAVCTDDAHRARGLATALMHTLAHTIRARGDEPFLHVAVENTRAIALYERLGFRRRASLAVVGARAPA